MSLQLQPITLKEAKRFIDDHHRHMKAPWGSGGLFAVAVNDGLAVIGVATVGRPVAWKLQDGYTCEVTRLATDGSRNACSMLYRASWRAARALGYRRLITYIRADETGTSLRAAGFSCKGPAGGVSWNMPNRPRVETAPPMQRQLWELAA